MISRRKSSKVTPKKELKFDHCNSMKEVNQKKSCFLDVVRIAWPNVTSKKIIRAFVFMCCCGGFALQTYTFLSFYLKYPTVVDVQVKRPEEMELPAITFCERPNRENQRDEECRHNCDVITRINKSAVANSVLPENDDKPPQMNAWQTLLLTCETYSRGYTTNCRLGNISHISVPDEAGFSVDCYTLFSKMDTLERQPLQIPKRKKVLLQMFLSLGSLRRSYDYGDDLPAVPTGQMSIHSPYTIVNPFNDGFVVEAENLYILQISMQEKKLLESPYDTHCTEYQKLWRERGGNGPLSHQMCMELCILNVTLQKFNCTAAEILYPHKRERLCDSGLRELDEENFSMCHSSCREECQFITYEYEIQRRRLDKSMLRNLAKKRYRRISPNKTAILQLYLKRPEILTFTHRPQFQFFETFSYIGGLLGIWLGVSLIAVLDVIEFSIGISSRIYNRVKSRQQRQRTHQIT